jgi:MOSC domain-containing protein YiiM
MIMATERIVGHIIAVCISEKTGMRKKNVGEGFMIEGFGIENDAHAKSDTHRQVSFLAQESIQKMQDMGLDVHAGDFAENITTTGVDLLALPLGTKIRLGDSALLEITQHGKECHTPCAIYHQAGTCVMPTEGIFGRVLAGGSVKVGDAIAVIDD